jgi:hypothetical protein
MLCAVLALASPRAFAATITVLPGDNIQAAIDAADAGDLLIIKGGAYTGSITIDKNLDFRREAGTTVHITGNVTLSGITGEFVFAHFRVGSDNNKNLTVTNCDNVFLEDVNATTGGGLSVTNSKVRGEHCYFSAGGTVTGSTEFYLYDCSFGGSATFNTSNWTMQECVITGNVTSNSSDTKVLRCNVTGSLAHNQTLDTNCTVFQSTIGERLNTKAKRSWIGYNTIRYILIDGSAEEAEIVGNDIDRRDSQGYCIQLESANLVATIRNNVIRRNRAGGRRSGIYVRRGSKIRIHNNVLHRIYGHGIEVYGDTNEAEIIGNFFAYIDYKAVEASFEGVTCDHNWVYNRGQIDNPRYGGGVAATNHQEGDPKFVAYNDDAIDANNDYNLQGASPLKNTGSPLPEFKNHDGTRQDIGLYGGHHYDANGTTSSKPVVLSADLAPIRIQKGVTSIVKVKSRAVVSTPKQ